MKNTLGRTKSTIKNATTGLETQLLITILQFVSRTVFIHHLGASYLGISGLFTNILSLLSLTELGLDTAINYKLYKPLATGDTLRLQVLMKFYQRAYLFVGCVIFGLGLLLVPFLPKLIKDYESIIELGLNPVLIFLLYLGQSSVSYLFFASKGAVLKADQKTFIVNRVRFFVTIIVSVVQIITLIIYEDFLVYTIIGISSTIIMNLVTAWIAMNKYPEVFQKTDKSLSKTEIQDIFKDLGAIFIFKVNDVVKKTTDNIVLSAFIGTVIVGLYSNYTLFFYSIIVFLNMVYSAADASMGNLFATEKVEKRFEFFQIMNYMTVVMFGTAAVGIAICADELITAWIGFKYVIPGNFPLLIGIEMYLHGLKQNLNQARNASGVFRQMWYRPLIGAIINIIISVWLVQVLGIHGVIIGTIASDVIANLLLDPIVIYKHSFNNIKSVRDYYFRNICYLIPLIVVYLLDFYLCKAIVIHNNLISVAVHIFVCAISVPIVYFAIFYKSREQKYLLQTMKKVLPKQKASV